MPASSLPVALTRAWIPRTGVEWLDELRLWHVGQVGAWERARLALDHARGDDFAGAQEDERLAAEELARIVENIVELFEQRRGDPIVAEVGWTPATVHRVRQRLALSAPARAGVIA